MGVSPKEVEFFTSEDGIMHVKLSTRKFMIEEDKIVEYTWANTNVITKNRIWKLEQVTIHDK